MINENVRQILDDLYANGLLDLSYEDESTVYVERVGDMFTRPAEGYLYFDENGQYKDFSELNPTQYRHRENDGYYVTKENEYSNSRTIVVGEMDVDGQKKIVKFNKMYGSHELDDSEIKSLLRNEPTTIETKRGLKTFTLGPGQSDLMILHKYDGPVPSPKKSEKLEQQNSVVADDVGYQVKQGKNGKEYVTGQMNIDGETKDVRFAKKYGSHELQDAEIKSLLKGEEITIPVRSGDAKVKLGEGIYMGHPYFGVQRTDMPEKSRRTPDVSDIQQDTPTSDKQAGE